MLTVMMNVVLVHGILDDGGDFKKMAEFLRDLGCKVFLPSLKPSSAILGIEDLAIKLKEYIQENLEANDKFTLVGFSMGCIVSRYYLQILGGVKNCSSFHAVSGPHKGSFLAYLFFGRGAKELRPGSVLLEKLTDTEYILEGLSLYSYRTPFDQMILPSKSSHWPIAKNHVAYAPIHSLMLRDKTVLSVIENAVKASRLYS